MNWQSAAALTGVVLAGINAGAFFVFSSFVMRGLGALPDTAGAAAMQEINRFAPNPSFMLTFLGAALVGDPEQFNSSAGRPRAALDRSRAL